MKKIIAVMLAILMVLSAFTACGGTKEEPVTAELNRACPFEPPTLDVHNMVDSDACEIALMFSEGLVRNKGGKIVPGIAESWEISEDGYEYTFHLRKSTWSDGTPLTAKDFIYSFTRVLDPDMAYQQATYCAPLMENALEYYTGEITDISQVGISAPDDYTLKLKVATPSSENIYQLATARFLPVKQDVAEANGASYGTEADKVGCNGPFIVTSWTHEDQLVLEKNEKYWNADEIKFAKVTSVINAQGQTAADMCLSGTLDYMTTTESEVRDLVMDSGEFNCESYTSQIQCLLFGGLNSGVDKYLDNANFVMAINYAIDREALTNTLLKGSIPATRITHPSMLGVEGLFVDEYPYEAWPVNGDPVKAKECIDKAMEELGCTIDDVPEITVLCYESEGNLLRIQAIQDMVLKATGIRLGIEQLPIQAMFGKVFSNDYDLWWSGMGVGSTDWGSPDSFLNNFDWRNPDYTGSWHNERFAELLDIVSTTYDIKTRKDALFEIEQIFVGEHPPFILVGFSQDFILYRNTLDGWLHSGYDDCTFMYETE